MEGQIDKYEEAGGSLGLQGSEEPREGDWQGELKETWK